MDEAEDTKQLNVRMESLAMQMASNRANIAKWGLSVAVFLFAILIIIIILISQGVGNHIVAPLAILGLATVWIIGWRRGRQLFKRFYTEELSGLQQKPSKEATAFMAQLTSREMEVLNYMFQGYINKQIAFELGISESTIKSHVSEILSKMNASDRTEAVVIAIKHGIFSIR